MKYLLYLLFCFPLVSFAQIPQEPTTQQLQNRLLAVPKIELITFGEKVFAYAFKYGLDNEDVSNSLKIMKCESSIRPDALNTKNSDGSWDYSWWQINNKRWENYLKDRGLDIKVPEQNLEAGFLLYSQFGVKLWKPSIKCHGLS